MGCCGITENEVDVETRISNYIKSLNQPEEIKRKLYLEIKEDLKKRATTSDKNNNPNTIEDVEKTVNYYKIFISNRLKSFDELNKITKKESQIFPEYTKNKNKDEDKITDKEIENNNNNKINKEETIMNNKQQTKLENNNSKDIIRDIKEQNNNDKKGEEKKEEVNQQEIKNKEIKEEIREEIKEIKENVIINEENTEEIKKTKQNIIINEENTEKIKEIKQNEEIREEKEKEKEDYFNWREQLRDDNNFSQKIPFNFADITFKLKKASLNPEKLNPFYTISAIFDFTKFFKEISSALSMGFSDITEKCGIMREKFNIYPDVTDIQNLLQLEINLDLHKLNGENNKKYGHKKDEYKNYISACRTFLRLLWFLEYLTDVFENVLKDDGTGPIKTILSNSYDKVLAPHHPFLVRKAVGFALSFSSAGNVAKNVDIIFGYKEYNEEARKAIQNTIYLMKIIWNGGNDFYVKKGLLDLE